MDPLSLLSCFHGMTVSARVKEPETDRYPLFKVQMDGCCTASLTVYHLSFLEMCFVKT